MNNRKKDDGKKTANKNMTSIYQAANEVKTKVLKFMVQSKSLYYFPSDAASPSFVFALCFAL